ncbi:solute carrier family 2, facilitated glucose transporter member 8-like [Acropora palmata]|uniref:solute carrier family 2, facilitated glucose transporter member 8-like n=1 Tax=Acropora palmata TaxID=6131 RepID=UPI003D9FDD81
MTETSKMKTSEPVKDSVSIQITKIPAGKESIRKSVLATFVAALGPLSFGFSLSFSSPVLVDLEESTTEIPSLRFNSEEASWFSSLVTLGAMFGSVIGGWTIDHFGRKGAIMACTVPFELGYLLIAFARNHEMLYAGRVISGVASGMVSLAVPVYIAEIVPARLRGTLGSINQQAITLGLFLCCVMGALVDWRWLAIIGAMPSVFLIIFMLAMPETPRWCLGKNRRTEALAGLRWLRGPEADIDQECFAIQETLDLKESMSWRSWLSPAILKPLVISIGLMFVQQFSGVNAVVFNAASIFKLAGFDNAKLVSISIGLMQCVGTVLGCLAMDRAGRRILLWTMALAMFVAHAGLGIFFQIYIPPEKDPGNITSTAASSVGSSLTHSVEASKISWLSILCLVLYNLAFAVAWGPVPWLAMSELFPLRARGPASSIAVLSNWLLAFAVTKTYHSMSSNLGMQGTYWFYAGCCLFGFVFVFLLMPETKGKTLEEIVAMFDRGKQGYARIG